MKILMDTSVLAAAMVEAHPFHEQSFPWLEGAMRGDFVGLVSAHSLAELYSILTTLPVSPKISPNDARQMIRENIVAFFEVISLPAKSYVEIIDHLAELGIVGGATYDALILRSAIDSEVDRVFTLNIKDFKRIYPQWADKLSLP